MCLEKETRVPGVPGLHALRSFPSPDLRFFLFFSKFIRVIVVNTII